MTWNCFFQDWLNQIGCQEFFGDNIRCKNCPAWYVDDLEEFWIDVYREMIPEESERFLSYLDAEFGFKVTLEHRHPNLNDPSELRVVLTRV